MCIYTYTVYDLVCSKMANDCQQLEGNRQIHSLGKSLLKAFRSWNVNHFKYLKSRSTA